MKLRNEYAIKLARYLLLLMMASLSACGGGGGGETASEPPTTTTTTTTTTTETTPEPTSLDDLVIDASNALQANYTLTINVDRSSQARGYFSLCDDYQSLGSAYSINFDSCLFRGPLIEGKLTNEVKIANHQSALIGVIWFYDGNDPQYQVWNYDVNAASQVLTMN